jgi:hypothetical protein
MLYEGVSARPTTIPLAEVRESVSGQPMSAAGHSRRFGRTTATFAVGTRVTSRPPHRSVRAQFGHTAPTLGV